MVVFTCNRCGDSLKKKDVEKHTYGRCSRPPFLTCVDCLKDFGEDYSKHFLCVSEEDRYGANGLKNKGLNKQQKWVLLVHETCQKALADESNGNVRELLEFLGEYPSIPDKEKPFRNFVINLRKYSVNATQAVWKILSEAKMEHRKKTEEESQNRVNGSSDITDQGTEAIMNGSCGESKTEPDESISVGDTHNPKEKKKKKQKIKSEDDCMMQNQDETVPDNVNTQKENEEDSKQDVIALSKKEKKEKRKREKYEAQLREIENEPLSIPQNPENIECENGERLKKKKKHSAVTNSMEDDPSGKANKKKKKRKHEDESGLTAINKKSKLNSAVDEGAEVDFPSVEKEREKFSWENAVFQVLKSKDEQEISIKRLSKKVINEYLTSLGEGAYVDDGKIHGKFLKKLSKMSNIVVHKDRVKVKTSRD